jgi:hypothetical protein
MFRDVTYWTSEPYQMSELTDRHLSHQISITTPSPDEALCIELALAGDYAVARTDASLAVALDDGRGLSLNALLGVLEDCLTEQRLSP